MFLDTLNELMKTNGYNKNSLAKESGIPYTTIVGFYSKGTDNVKLSTLRKLANFFGVSLDYLINGEKTKTPLSVSTEELKLINQYRNLNNTGQRMLIEHATMMTASGLYQKEPSKTVFIAARNGKIPVELPENPELPDAPDTI